MPDEPAADRAVPSPAPAGARGSGELAPASHLETPQAVPGATPPALPAGSLSVDEIIERLDPEPGKDVIDKEIIDDIYVVAEKQLAAEDAYATKLDARATSLFGAVGFSMTLAFSFGGWALLDHASNVPFGHLIAWAFVGVLALGLLTSVIALRGLLLRPGHRFIDERDVFHPGVVAKGKKRVDFRIHLATHHWLIWQRRAERNQARAATVRLGQLCFVGFLTAILFLSVITTVSAITRAPTAPTPPPAASNTPSSTPTAMPSATPIPSTSPPPSLSTVAPPSSSKAGSKAGTPAPAPAPAAPTAVPP